MITKYKNQLKINQILNDEVENKNQQKKTQQKHNLNYEFKKNKSKMPL
jgi:hypothetical protein